MYSFIDFLKSKHITVATAESCTGGLIAKLITDVPGSSKIFIGGVVSYSNEMKMKLLGVNQSTLIQYGAVSEQTVSKMLDGILQITGADLAVAVSGIAGPEGGTALKPVGTVIIGVAYKNQRLIRNFLFDGTRTDIRNKSVQAFVDLARKLIEKEEVNFQKREA